MRGTPQPPHCNELQHALFDILQPIVVLVQHLQGRMYLAEVPYSCCLSLLKPQRKALPLQLTAWGEPPSWARLHAHGWLPAVVISTMAGMMSDGILSC